MEFIRETKDIDFLFNFINQKTKIWISYKKKDTCYLFTVAFNKEHNTLFSYEDKIITIIDGSDNGNKLYNYAHICLEEEKYIIYYKTDNFEQCKIYLKDGSMYTIKIQKESINKE